MEALESRIKGPKAGCGTSLGNDGEVVYNAAQATAILRERVKERCKTPNKPPS